MNPPVDLPAYERIFRTIHSIVEHEHADPTKSCVFFGVVGAYLLAQHHGLKLARPMMGLAAYNLRTPTNFFTIYGREVDGEIIAADEGFHCWVDADEWIIDFSAPLFGDTAPPAKLGAKVPPLMFAKPKHGGARSLAELNLPGAYLHRPDPVLTASLLTRFIGKRANGDLANICAQWYVPPPGVMPEILQIGDEKGTVSEVRLSSVAIEGSW